MKLPLQCTNILDAARAASREQLKVDLEQKAKNAEWRHLHEMGSPVACINHDEQHCKGKSE
jgi:hypothetical protein